LSHQSRKSQGARRESVPTRLRSRSLRSFFCAAAILLFLGCFSSLALEVPPGPERRVTDRTGALTAEQIERLDQKLAAFERETTNQIVVLLIPSLEGDSLEDYSIRLAEKWKVGQKGRNNGVILLIVKNDRKVRLEVGYGLEGALPDALAGTIIRNEIGPRFRNGEFYQGIDAGVNAVMSAIKGEYKASPGRRGSPVPPWLPFLLVLAFMVFFSMAASRARKRSYHSGGSRGWRSGGGFFGGGFFGGGSGGGFPGGGGFSGGGGSFGGGGASGEW
jgi:uncharacterized protein